MGGGRGDLPQSVSLLSSTDCGSIVTSRSDIYIYIYIYIYIILLSRLRIRRLRRSARRSGTASGREISGLAISRECLHYSQTHSRPQVGPGGGAGGGRRGSPPGPLSPRNLLGEAARYRAAIPRKRNFHRLHARARARTPTHNTRTHTNTSTNTYARAHIHTHTHTHTRIHTHTHTHKQTR